MTIGCLHHTGDMKAAIGRCWRLLRYGGSLTMMVYNAYSYRRWMQAWRQTLRYLVKEILGDRCALGAGNTAERWAYDHDSDGTAAPHTDVISVKSLRGYCRQFSSITCRRRNIGQEPPFQNRIRPELLRTRWPTVCGLDVYASAVK